MDRRAPRVHLPDPGVDRQLRVRPRQRAGLRLRHRLQRQRDRRRVDPYPRPGRAGAGVRGDGHHRGGGEGEVRLPARGVRLRRPAARWHRLRLGPDRGAARRCRLDPGRDRVPEVRWRLRPAHRSAGADHRRPAQGGRCRRRAGGEGWRWCRGRHRGCGGSTRARDRRGGVSTTTAPTFSPVRGLGDLPEPWRSFPFLTADVPRYTGATAWGDHQALALSVVAGDRSRRALVGVGEPAPLAEVVAGAFDSGGAPVPGSGLDSAPVAVASLTRGAWDLLPEPVRTHLDLEHVAHWDWLLTTTAPPHQDGEEQVVELDLVIDREEREGLHRCALPETYSTLVKQVT